MSNTPVTPNPTDVGMATGPAPTPAAPSAIQPNPAAQPTAQPSDNSNSNAPDASTPAAKSIPANLINNPAAPTQKMAAQADANKNSAAPNHTMLYNAAIEMTGGQRYTTSLDAEGNTVRTPIQPKPWALGLALALNVLSGGLAGGGAKNVGDAARAGAAVADKQRLAVQQANAHQDAQAIGDQKNKMAITEGKMRLHLLAQQVGASDKAISQTLPDAYKSLTDGLMDGSTPMTNGASMEKPAFETDAAAAVKNGKTNITHDAMFPVGDAIPVMENGQQKFVNGQALYGHNYIVVHNADKLQTQLTDDVKTKLQSIGYFRNPDGTPADIGNPQWSFADLSKKMSEYAAVQTGEAMLNQHLNDAHDYLGTDEKDIPKLKDLATEVRTSPDMRKAIQTFSRYGGTMPLDVILYNMNQTDPQGAAKIMGYLGLTPKMLGDMADARAKEDAEAKAGGKTEAVNPDTMGKALALLNDPAASADRKKQAQGVVDGFNKQEQQKADNAADAAAAKEDYKQSLKDQRTMGYVEDQNGDVYHVSRWQADHMPNYSAQTFIEKKPSDVSADQKAIKPINDIQNNINGYRTANAAYDAAAKGNKVNVAGDRSNLTTIFSAPAITDAAAAHAGVEGFGMTIPTLAADLNKNLATKVLNAYNALSPEGKTMADSYARMRGAIPAYVKVITNAGRGSKEQLDIELQNIMPPYFNQRDIGHRIETFQGNLDTQKAGFPKNLAGSHFVEKSGGPSAQTHNFSLSAWQKANPTGDANAAKAAAQKQGLTVVQ
jgi:hypothetical protein